MRHKLVQHIQFTPVDPKFATVEVIRNAFAYVLMTLPILIPAIIWGSTSSPGILLWIGVFLMVAAGIFFTILAVRQARMLGYVELEEELLVRKGIMFQSVTVVPYGRMQQVNLGTGPLLNRFGLANVELVTASASTDARITGVRREEAERLREKLTALGSANMEGL